MKILFLASVLSGLLGTIAGARFYPWVDLERFPSHTSVVANGGRSEKFLIRLPADRIASRGSSAMGLRAAPFPQGSAPFSPAANSEPLMIEHYKVRDASGTVIGLAARHWTEADGAATATWLLVIPSRGALLLAASGEPPRALDAALAAGGWRSGETWSGDVDVMMTADTQPGRVVGGEEEFADLGGRYTETWRVAGIGGAGELRGTIELDTVMFRAPSVSVQQE